LKFVYVHLTQQVPEMAEVIRQQRTVNRVGPLSGIGIGQQISASKIERKIGVIDHGTSGKK
jgi:hypothetical protein